MKSSTPSAKASAGARESLSAKDARRIALHAQGLDARRDKTVLDVIDRFGMLQIDSVNVFERAHYMPMFSRIGRYDKSELDSLTGGFNPTLIEYWAHEASFIRTEDLPLYNWRRDWYRDRAAEPGSFARENAKLCKWILAEIAANGPMPAGAFEHEQNKRGDSWWGWSNVKRSLERMFLTGQLVSGGRHKFQRLYALPEQVLPAEVLNREITHFDAKLELLNEAGRLMGVGTAKDIADVHRFRSSHIKPEIQALVDSGILVPVKVEGWREQAYLHRDYVGFDTSAIKPALTTVLSPFDPLTWFRERAERIFGFEYRIEIYTPEPKRIFGYYTLPILHKEQLVGRIDLKSDRQNGQLLVQSAWHEHELSGGQVSASAKALAKHLGEVKRWQGLNDVQVKPKGNLSLELATHFV